MRVCRRCSQVLQEIGWGGKLCWLVIVHQDVMCYVQFVVMYIITVEDIEHDTAG